MEQYRAQLGRMAQVREEARAKNIADRSKAGLKKIIETKFQTTFIGAINAIEELFGYLWGYQKHPADRTEEENLLYNKWQELRTRILDNGNHQKRSVLNELEQYLVTWKGHDTKLLTRSNGNELRS